MACFAIYLVLCLVSTIALNSVFRAPTQRWYAKSIVWQIALLPVSSVIFTIWHAWQFDAIARGPQGNRMSAA